MRDDEDTVVGMRRGDPEHCPEHALRVRFVRLAHMLDPVAFVPVRPSQLPQSRSRRSGSATTGRAEPLGDDLGRLARAGEVARVDGVDVVAGEPVGERARLLAAVVVERLVGVTLQPALGVPVGLAVSYEQQGGHQ